MTQPPTLTDEIVARLRGAEFLVSIVSWHGRTIIHTVRHGLASYIDPRPPGTRPTETHEDNLAELRHYAPVWSCRTVKEVGGIIPDIAKKERGQR